MFPFSSLTAVSVISNLPLEVTTCKFRILDEGGFSRDKTVSDTSQIAMRGFWHTLIARGRSYAGRVQLKFHAPESGVSHRGGELLMRTWRKRTFLVSSNSIVVPFVTLAEPE